MKFLNQKGATLIITLLAITLTILVSSALMSSILTVRQQSNQAEKIYQADAAAEMGLTYYKAYIVQEVNKANEAAKAKVEEFQNSSANNWNINGFVHSSNVVTALSSRKNDDKDTGKKKNEDEEDDDKDNDGDNDDRDSKGNDKKDDDDDHVKGNNGDKDDDDDHDNGKGNDGDKDDDDDHDNGKGNDGDKDDDDDHDNGKGNNDNNDNDEDAGNNNGDQQTDTLEMFNKEFCTQLYNNIKDFRGQNIPVDGGVQIKEITTDINLDVNQCTSKPIIIKIYSTGKVDDVEKTVTGIVKIEQSIENGGNAGGGNSGGGNGSTSDEIPAYSLTFTKVVDSFVLKGNDEVTYDGFVDFINVATEKGNPKLTINGSARFRTQLTLRGNIDLIIHGDAFFNQRVRTNGVAYTICIKGKSYLLDSSTNKYIIYKDSEIDFTNSCAGSTPSNPVNLTSLYWTVSNIMEVTY